MRALDEWGWYALWRLPLPQEPSVKLLNLAMKKLFEFPQHEMRCCHLVDWFAETLKTIVRAYPDAYERDETFQSFLHAEQAAHCQRGS